MYDVGLTSSTHGRNEKHIQYFRRKISIEEAKWET
jgi:hypothetical protein